MANEEKRLMWNPMNAKLVFCINSKKENLGYLKYERVGRYLHWCWHQYDGVKMSPGCLEEIRDKQKELFTEVRLSKNHHRKRDV